MKKRRLTLFALFITLSLSLVACGTSNSSSGQDGKSQTKTTSVKDGLNQLLASSKKLKSAISQNDEEKVATIGPKLEDEWSAFEDQIKPNYPDNYGEVEKYLDPAIAGSKSKPLDKKTLLPLVDNLIQAVQDLSDKIIN